jgi:ribosomal protein L30/L7E
MKVYLGGNLIFFFFFLHSQKRGRERRNFKIIKIKGSNPNKSPKTTRKQSIKLLRIDQINDLIHWENSFSYKGRLQKAMFLERNYLRSSCNKHKDALQQETCTEDGWNGAFKEKNHYRIRNNTTKRHKKKHEPQKVPHLS